jgi:hypothetical protein
MDRQEFRYDGIAVYEHLYLPGHAGTMCTFRFFFRDGVRPHREEWDALSIPERVELQRLLWEAACPTS